METIQTYHWELWDHGKQKVVTRAKEKVCEVILLHHLSHY